MTNIGDDRLKASGDEIYACLMDAHRGLSAEVCARLNARLVLILINLVADKELVIAAIAKAAQLT